MADFNDTYRKAGILMTSALKKYEQGDFEGGDKDRKMANEMYDKAEEQVNSTEALYGESRNFGVIYKVFESNVPKLFKNKKENGKIKKVLDFIVENKVLKAEFDVYNILTNPENVTDAEAYVNEAITLIPMLDKKTIVENNQKFINLIRELNMNELVNVTDDEAKLFESIEYLLLNTKNYRNISNYSTAKKCITESIEKNARHSVSTNENIDDVYNNGIKAIEESYRANLNESEKMFFEKLNSLQNKEAYFDIAKLDTIKTLNSQLNECESDEHKSIEKIVENVSKMQYNDKTFISNSAEFREIKNTLLQEGTMSNDCIEALCTELAKKFNGEEGRSEDWLLGEISYNTPDYVDAQKIFDDVRKLSKRYKPEDVGYMIVTNMIAGNYNGWWNESKKYVSGNMSVNEDFNPSDSFDGQAVDNNGCMLPINDMKAIVDYASQNPEYIEQLPPIIRKAVEDCKKYFEENPT